MTQSYQHHIVGIAQFRDGWRVAKDASNLYWWPDRHNGVNKAVGNWVELDSVNPGQFYTAFCTSPIYRTYWVAFGQAEEMVKELSKDRDNIYIREIIGYSDKELSNVT